MSTYLYLAGSLCRLPQTLSFHAIACRPPHDVASPSHWVAPSRPGTSFGARQALRRWRLGTTPDSTAYNFAAPPGSAHGVITGGRRERDSMKSLSAAANTKMRGTVRDFSFSPQRGSLFPARPTLSPGEVLPQLTWALRASGPGPITCCLQVRARYGHIPALCSPVISPPDPSGQPSLSVSLSRLLLSDAGRCRPGSLPGARWTPGVRRGRGRVSPSTAADKRRPLAGNHAEDSGHAPGTFGASSLCAQF